MKDKENRCNTKWLLTCGLQQMKSLDLPSSLVNVLQDLITRTVSL